MQPDRASVRPPTPLPLPDSTDGPPCTRPRSGRHVPAMPAFTLALLAWGCGGVVCPTGTEDIGGRCLTAAHDGSTEDAATEDAAIDAAVPPDGAPPADGSLPVPFDGGGGLEDAGPVCATTAETCNGLDEDCDTRIDEGVLVTFFADQDGDGYGHPRLTMTGCAAPDGYVARADDCDDLCGACHPDAAEVCERLDNDCDGTVDEGVTVARFSDDDGDGVGGAPIAACPGAPDTVERGGDCNDLAVTAYPGAPERCDGLDNDCGGVVDELYPCVRGSAVTCATACGSQGMGTCSATCMQPSFAACAAPAESCNAHDDDCDGRVDETWLSFGPGRTLTAAGMHRVELVATATGFVAGYNTATGLFVQRLDAGGAPLGSAVLVGDGPVQFSLAATSTQLVVATIRAGIIGAVLLRPSDLGTVATLASLLPSTVFASRIRVVASGTRALFLFHDGARVRAAARTLPGFGGTDMGTVVGPDCAVEFDAALDTDGARVLVATAESTASGDVWLTPITWTGAASGPALRVTNDADAQRLPALATLARPDGSRRYGVAFIDDVAAAGAPDPLLFANVEAAADGTMRVRDILRLTTSSTVALTGGGAALDVSAGADHFSVGFMQPAGSAARISLTDIEEPPGASALAAAAVSIDATVARTGFAQAAGPTGSLAAIASGTPVSVFVRACR